MSSTPAKSTFPPNINESTRITKGADNVIHHTLHFVSNAAERIDACIDNTRPSLLVEIEPLREAFGNAKRRGTRLNYITEITNENISYCKQLLQIVNELRHIDGVKGNFYVSAKEYIAPAKFHELGKPASQLIYSNVAEFVEQQQFVFDSLWKLAIPAKQKIMEIEHGVILEETIVYPDYRDAIKKEFEMLNKAKKEIQIMYSTVNAFHMQEKGGILQLLKEMAEQNKNLEISILSPIDKSIKDSAYLHLLQKCGHNIRIQNIAPSISIKIKSLVVDRKESLIMEMEHQKGETATNLIGLSFYSNSESIVLSYASIFEVLYNQSILFQQLKQEDIVKSEFIDIAAHELRTPIMPILMGIEILEEKLGDNVNDYRREIDIIARNASRLQNLAQSILQVSKIESGTFSLSIQSGIDMHSLIAQVIEDVERKYAYTDKADKISIVFFPLYDETKNDNVKSDVKSAAEEKIAFQHPKQHNEKENEHVREENTQNNRDNYGPLYADCDSQKIAQVIFNLLDNAMKFTFDGKIIVTTDTVISDHSYATNGESPNNSKEPGTDKGNKPSNESENNSNDSILVTVMDTGAGIKPQNKNQLFEKFATKSHQGTGLGLYLSKKIIESHGGKIWHEEPSDKNNKDIEIFSIGNNKKIGTIFKFTIPMSLVKKQDSVGWPRE